MVPWSQVAGLAVPGLRATYGELSQARMRVSSSSPAVAQLLVRRGW